MHIGFFEYWLGFVKSYVLTAGILGISYAILQSMTTSAAENEEQAGQEAGYGTMVSAFFVSGLNGALPTVLKMITLKMEVHIDEGDVQTSMLRKLMIARCLNTAVLIYAVTDFTDQFGVANLTQIQSLLIADAVTAPVMRVLNIYEHVMHYVVGPTKKTQSQMNTLFQGAYWNLAERYTDMIKTLFVGLFFSVMVPSSLFITAAAMAVTYLVDKYCLLRMWSRPPMYDEEMATASRKMIMVCVWVHLIMARVMFSNWPYSTADDKAACGLFQCQEPVNGWTDDQATIVGAYTTVGILLFAFGIILGFFKSIKSCCGKLFCQSVDEVGEASTVQFRNLTGVVAYVPGMRRATLVNPLFVCDVSRLPRSYIPCRPTDFDGNPLDANTLSVMSDHDCPFANQPGAKEIMFGECKFYQPEQLMPQQQVMQQQGVHPGQVQMTMPNQAQMRGGMPMQQQQMAMAPVQAAGMRPMAVGGMPQGVPQQQQHMPQQQQGMPQQQQQRMPQQQQRMPQQQQRMPQQMAQQANTPLPNGWEEKCGPDGRSYFVNHATKKTQWTRPQYKAPRQQMMQGGQKSMRSLVLPAGWEAKKAADGRPYYVDHNTGSTHWVPPGAGPARV